MEKSKINSNQVLQIRNILRLLGFNQSINGTKLINKAVQYLVLNQDEYFELYNIYEFISKTTSFTPNQIKSLITYAIIHRDILKSKKNFERVFNFDYDEYVFTAKKLIEEIANIIE